MTIVYGAIMVIALIGMIICSKKQKTNPAMQPIAFVLFIVVVIGGVMLLRETGTFGGQESSLLKNEMAFYASQGTEVGQYLAQNNPGKKVLLLVEDVNNENVKGLANALKEGYGGEVVLDTIGVTQQNPEMPMPLYMIMKAADFDAALEKNADAGIVVSTIGLPQDALRMKYWKTAADKRPMLFLIGTPSGQISGLAAAVAKGDIAGVVVSNPEAKYDVAAPSDPNEAFDIRYVLVDKNNVEQYKNQLM